jgi:hypothetical protein
MALFLYYAVKGALGSRFPGDGPRSSVRAEDRRVPRPKSGSRQWDDPLLGWREQVEFRQVSEEELEAEQDRNGITRRIASWELGQQKEGAAQMGWLIGGEPDINPTQVAAYT